ncbi:unnamed protein product [Schistosoma mattheei]|uniref:Uncharacterized protein n=1 Tax=Schistosoma mattheei TaxID=31246 RepID=A0A183PES9_9TREM|nr:unnamed protein product [Schistosoma mattheei]
MFHECRPRGFHADADSGTGWKKRRGGQCMTWCRGMKESCKGLASVGPSRLHGWVRKTVWEYWVRRASGRYFGPTTGLCASNDQRIQDIRRLRRTLAKYLGCKDWLSVVWSSPYSHSPSSPDELIANVLEPSRSILTQVGERDFKLLKEWANVNLDISGKDFSYEI